MFENGFRNSTATAAVKVATIKLKTKPTTHSTATTILSGSTVYNNSSVQLFANVYMKRNTNGFSDDALSDYC